MYSGKFVCAPHWLAITASIAPKKARLYLVIKVLKCREHHYENFPASLELELEFEVYIAQSHTISKSISITLYKSNGFHCMLYEKVCFHHTFEVVYFVDVPYVIWQLVPDFRAVHAEGAICKCPSRCKGNFKLFIAGNDRLCIQTFPSTSHFYFTYKI